MRLLLLILVCLYAPVFGQFSGESHLAFDRPEVWAMKYYATVTLFGGMGASDRMEPGAYSLGLELAEVPFLSTEERRVGFNGTKVEDLNKSTVFIRPEITLGLPQGFSLSAAYAPPVRVFDIESNLLALAVNKDMGKWRNIRLSLRAFGQIGDVKGSFTCAEEVVSGDEPNPFNCIAPSHDEVTLRYAGIEGSLTYEGELLWRAQPFVAFSAQHMELIFQVDALHSGIHDRQRLVSDGWTEVYSAGVKIPLGERVVWAAALRYSPVSIRRPEWGVTRNNHLLQARTRIAVTF